MTLNGVNIHTIQCFYFNGDLNNFEDLIKAMDDKGINTDKVDILNITTAINDYGQCEQESSLSSFDDSITITLQYTYIVHYTLEG